MPPGFSVGGGVGGCARGGMLRTSYVKPRGVLPQGLLNMLQTWKSGAGGVADGSGGL